ncbi:glycosyl hydrolase family 18 protein [Cohnella lupini]|uniref:Spore germination protein YaaH n=1 Tax=Cohnella lupini TaxID=1294267 RepID=A0A3D9I4K1_9BACL|nr:glycosyl hydrolase family 18 protein [Cohnella lupini]RED56713.1 spore germination protein YaaH [Cohnella lupini]
MNLNTDLMAGPRRSRRRTGRWIFLMLVFVVAAASVMWWQASHSANSSYVKPQYTSKPFPIMIQGKWTEAYAQGTEKGLLVPLPVAQSLLGDGVHYEEKTESIILTTNTKVLHFKTGELDATLNRKPFALTFAAKKVDGELYLPLAPLTELFGVKMEIGESSGIVSFFMPEQAVQHAAVPEKTVKGIKLREGPGKSFAIVEDIPGGSDLRLWGESDGWYMAQSKSGNIGYVAKAGVSLLAIETIDPVTSTDEPFVAWKGTGKRINLTWEAVYSANPDTSKIGALAGVNVVSPTWFELVDGKGKIRSIADSSYSTWARSKGIQVWGLFSNGFEPDRTHTALASYESRFAMIQQMLAYAKTFKLQGINIDFENVYTKDKDNLVQFMREMTPIMHEQNLVVSIDVTPISNSEMWSAFLDRERLGSIVDFMMVMAYDEHWAASPVAGSVSSLPWVETSIKRILEEDGVPSDKLILGMPLYTRMWTDNPTADKEEDRMSSKTMDMDAVNELIKEKKLKPVYSEETGQNYVEFKEGTTIKKIWIEDATSIQARALLAKKYNLAGVASWRRGFESSDIWGVLDKELQSRP